MEKNDENIITELNNGDSQLKHLKLESDIIEDNINSLNKKEIDKSSIPSVVNKEELNNINIKVENLTIDKGNQNLKSDVNITKVSVKTQYKIFIPFVTLKILIPSFFMSEYLVYGIKNIEDQTYFKYSIYIFVFYVLFLYYLSVFTSSSQTNVDKYFTQNVFTYKTGTPGSEINNLEPARWIDCRFCHSKKFERSSHCRICNKCVLMRDHHCPYIANCVGFKNIQYFFNFVFWANVGNIFYIYLFINFMFFSGVKINIAIYTYIFLYIDLALNLFFIFNINSIFVSLLMAVYNNWTQKESLVFTPVELYCPIYTCERFSYNREDNNTKTKRDINYYNIGFLSHIYYLIGPTISHLMFPLPKYKNYTLDENCPVFKELYRIGRLDILRYMVKKDQNQMKLMEENSSPESYIKLCHQYYDGKTII